MIDDSRRREVARRLRELADHCDENEMSLSDDDWPGILSDHIWPEDGGHHIYDDDCRRLADLIDPGEPGQNLDKNRDTVQIESPAVQKAPECDRDALLELADDLDRMGDGSMYDPCISDEHGIARRIREALGVSERP